MDILQQPALPRPDHSAADCHRSREPFDAAFRCINERRDIAATAKLVHAHLVTLHRTGAAATQTEIGAAIGCSRHQVWAALQQLATAELIQAVRHGQGRPNSYVLLGVPAEDLDRPKGPASSRRPVRQVVSGQSGTVTRGPSIKNTGARTGTYPRVNTDSAAFTSGELSAYVRT